MLVILLLTHNYSIRLTENSSPSDFDSEVLLYQLLLVGSIFTSHYINHILPLTLSCPSPYHALNLSCHSPYPATHPILSSDYPAPHHILILPCPAMPCRTMSSPLMPCPVLLCLAIPCPTLYIAIPYPVHSSALPSESQAQRLLDTTDDRHISAMETFIALQKYH